MAEIISPQIISKTLFSRVKGFQEIKDGMTILDNSTIEKSQNMQDRLNSVRLTDINLKILARLVFIIFFCLLLVGQNIFVFYLVAKALDLHQIANLQLVFSVLVSATLLETYYVAREIVTWTFREIDYDLPKEKS